VNQGEFQQPVSNYLTQVIAKMAGCIILQCLKGIEYRRNHRQENIFKLFRIICFGYLRPNYLF
jgi:hypothetical protein